MRSGREGVTMRMRRVALPLLAAVLTAGCALPSPATPEPTTPVPPRALLVAPGQQPVEGAVGTYTWEGFASDGPWLIGAGPVRIAPDVLASLRFPPEEDVGEWEVRYAPVEGTTADAARATLQTNLAGPEVDFPAPPTGTWSVRLEVEFVGRGRVTYYWRFEVAP